MKRYLFSVLVTLAAMPLMAQVAKSFKVNISADGEAWMQVYMPKNPTGRAIVDCPGGGYSGLAMDHEGYDWVPYFTERGITFAVLKYRMPKGDRTIPMGDAQAAVKKYKKYRINIQRTFNKEFDKKLIKRNILEQIHTYTS